MNKWEIEVGRLLDRLRNCSDPSKIELCRICHTLTSEYNYSSKRIYEELKDDRFTRDSIKRLCQSGNALAAIEECKKYDSNRRIYSEDLRRRIQAIPLPDTEEILHCFSRCWTMLPRQPWNFWLDAYDSPNPKERVDALCIKHAKRMGPKPESFEKRIKRDEAETKRLAEAVQVLDAQNHFLHSELESAYKRARTGDGSDTDAETEDEYTFI